MKRKTNKTLVIFAASTFAICGIVGTAQAIEPVQRDTAGQRHQKGRFREVKLVNRLTGYKVELFLNNSTKPLVAAQNAQAQEDFSGIKGGFQRIHWLRFLVKNLRNHHEVTSGEIEFEWITRNMADAMQEVVHKLEEKGITAEITEEADDTLVITIVKVS